MSRRKNWTTLASSSAVAKIDLVMVLSSCFIILGGFMNTRFLFILALIFSMPIIGNPESSTIVLFIKQPYENSPERSLEFIDINTLYEEINKLYCGARDPLGKDLAQLAQENNPKDYKERYDKITQKLNELSQKESAEYAVLYAKRLLVYTRIKKIMKDIVHERGASAIIGYTDHAYSLNYVDPSFDVTDEVYNRLNLEYLSTKNK
jgi:Skp family chaperone for outer membrane proteins